MTNSSLRKQLMALPVADRLEEALYLLEEVTGRPSEAFSYLKRTYGLTPGESQILCALNACSPLAMTKEALYAVFNTEATEIKIIDVYVCKIRKKIRADIIETLWGQGYRMPVQIDIPLKNVTHFRPKQGTPWTVQDDEDLLMMEASGSHLSIMADELQRSERGVKERLWSKGK